MDWKDYGVESIVKRILNNKNLDNGSIVLLNHGAKHTPEALVKVILELKEQGFELVPVSELIYKSNFVVDNRGRQMEN